MYAKWRKLVVLFLLGLIGTTVVLEVGLRILGAHHPALYETDPILGFRLKPNQQVRFFGNEISINHYGVRDARSFATKGPDTTRILVLGDSVTWGGVRLPQHALFTSILERELGDAEVINAGVNGYSVWRMAALYREHLLALQPDVVVFYVIPGDFYRAAVVDLVNNTPAFPLENSTFALSMALTSARIVLASRLDWNWIRPKDPSLPRDNLSDEERVSGNIEAIVLLAQELAATQQLIVVVSPYPDRPENPPLPESVNRAMSRADIELLILDDDSLREEENFVDHIHFNTRGHARVGRALAQYLRESEAKS